MSQRKIERVDSIPLIVTWLLKMKVDIIIDRIWTPHSNWTGLSYGQLAILFVTFVISERTHALSRMEKWISDHQFTLEEVTKWQIGLKEATDDRLGILLEAIGSDDRQAVEFQLQMGQQLIQAYELPTNVARYDTTSINVHHAPAESEEQKHELLRHGYSKDKRPDLLQFKIGLGTLDPAGIPLLTHTLSGEVADDGQYVPAWQQMVKAIGHQDFLFVADCKAAAISTRATISSGGGSYLFPMPMTGQVPKWLETQLSQNVDHAQEITLPGVVDQEGQPKIVGKGFVIEREMEVERTDEDNVVWQEQWFVTQSYAHAARQQAALDQKLDRTLQKVHSMRPKKGESATDFKNRVEIEIKKRGMSPYLTFKVIENTTIIKKYKQRGRPTAKTPYELIEQIKIELEVEVQEQLIDKSKDQAGWRVYVSNRKSEQMCLNQAVAYYRDEWLVENCFHRYKGGSLPVLPLWLRIPQRIKGLILLLLIALQALTLLEFVAKRSLLEEKSKVSGLVPGNPSRKSARPSAERLLDAFDQLHLVVEINSHGISGSLNEQLSPLQKRILALLKLSETIYDLTFTHPLLYFNDSS